MIRYGGEGWVKVELRMMINFLDWVFVVVLLIKGEMVFRGRSMWDKVECIGNKVLSWV